MYHYLIIIFLGGDRYEKVDTGISGMPANKIPINFELGEL